MLKFEETDGFVNFPPINSKNVVSDDNKTLVYLVAFDWSNVAGGKSILSNNKLNVSGTLVSDDITGTPYIRSNNNLKNIYFSSKGKPIPFVTSICLGWTEKSFKIKDDTDVEQDWFCTFRELTNEGRKLYYSIKKLHNNKEVRILTFTNIEN